MECVLLSEQTAHGVTRLAHVSFLENEKKPSEEGREKIRNALPAADMIY